MTNLSLVRNIVEITRQELKSFIEKHSNEISVLGLTPNFQKDWCGSCLVCSYILNRLFFVYDIKSDLCIGSWNDNCHAFVLVDDQYVVDITGSQFDLPDITIEELSGSLYNIWKRGTEAYCDFCNWPKSQQPAAYLEELNKIYDRVKELLKEVA